MGKNSVKINQFWAERMPYVSLITPVFNRRKELQRCFESVKRQTYKDFEYIVVNDGSTENIDDIVEYFMEAVDFPVMYIKKGNGGVHTARNIGIQYARGTMISFLDSDDEELDGGLKILVDAWLLLPNREKYSELKARTIDQNGNLDGKLLPEDINFRPMPERVKLASHGEFVGIRPASIMKANPWPEPEGITFVGESILWDKLHHEYESYFINEIVQIYHKETDISYSNRVRHKRSLQWVKNTAWNLVYTLNSPEIYNHGVYIELISQLRFCVFDVILRRYGISLPICLTGLKNKILHVLMYVPAWIISFWYVKKRICIEE